MTDPLVVRRAGLVLALALLVTAGAVWGATRIEAQVDFVDTVPDHPGLQPYRHLLQDLDGVRFVAVYMAHDPQGGVPHLRSDEGFDALVAEQQELTRRLQAAFPPDTFSHTLSAYEAMKGGNYMLAKMATVGNPPESAYALPGDPVTWQAVRQQTLEGGSLDDVVARDGSSALLLAFLTTQDDREARSLSGEVAAQVRQWSDDGAHPATTDHATSGLLYASHYTDQRNRAETLQWAPVAALGVALALLWVTRRASNVAIAVVSLLCALAWTYGIMGWSGMRISFLSVFLAPVVVGIGIDHAVHILHRYEEERSAGAGHRDALATSLRRTGRAVALAAATTVAGLATLLLVPSPLFSEIGLLAALGVGLGSLAALSITPALRTVMPPATPRSADDRVGRALASWASRVSARPAAAIAIVAVLTVGAVIVAATQTTIESGSAENEFPQDDPVIVLQHRIEQEYGAFQRAYLVVQGDLTEPRVLRAMHDAVAASASLPLFRDASAVTDLLLADEATDDGAVDLLTGAVLGTGGVAPDDSTRLPQTREEARQRLDALFADPLWRTIVPFTISGEYDLGVVAITLEPWQDQAQLRALRDALVEHAAVLQAAIGEDGTTRVAAAGAPVNRAAILDQTPWNLTIATLGATAAVGLVLGVAWHRRGVEGWRMAAVGSGVVLLAAVWLLASVPLLDGAYRMMGSWGAPTNRAPLTDMFLLAFAVTVAVGVDDVVHVASRYWEARDDGAPSRAAVRHAFTHAGRAITGTTLTTFTAFALMAGLYFLQSKNLAILTAAGVLWAYILTLLLVPRLLGGRSQDRSPPGRVAEPQ